MRAVPTFLALTTARAGLATKEMGAFVKVKFADKCHDKTEFAFISSFSYSDLDECEKGRHNCHINANCTNTPCFYNCKCRPGYTGNGSICKGRNLPVNFYDAPLKSRGL